MPIENYGVWVGRPVRVTAERQADDPHTPHIHLFYDDGTGGRFDGSRRASINVKSGSGISELVFWLKSDYRHPVVDALRDFRPGFHPLPSTAMSASLDYIRGNLMELASGRVLPHDRPGARDDIIDFVMPELEDAIRRRATVYLFGEPYDDRQGMHDIHMNQGSQGQFQKYDGVWQDGGLFLQFPDEARFSAIFLAFASQAAHTDEVTGHALAGSQNLAQLIGQEPPPGGGTIADDRRVAIVASLVNPIGGENQPDSSGRPELVYLLNRSAQGLSLGGWSLLNKNDEAHVISSDIWLEAGEVRSVTMGGAPLSNGGGLISLLDAEGHKVDGVSYTREQARKEGELIIFRE